VEDPDKATTPLWIVFDVSPLSVNALANPAPPPDQSP